MKDYLLDLESKARRVEVCADASRQSRILRSQLKDSYHEPEDITQNHMDTQQQQKQITKQKLETIKVKPTVLTNIYALTKVTNQIKVHNMIALNTVKFFAQEITNTHCKNQCF